MTQENLAWAVDLSSKGYLSRIESGQRLPSLKTLDRLAHELGVEVSDLFIFPERSEVDVTTGRVRRDQEGATMATKSERAKSRAPGLTHKPRRG